MYLVGQLIGFAAMAVSSVIFLQKERKQLLAIKLFTDVLWALHHLLLGNTIAAITTSAAILREILFMIKLRHFYLVVFPILFFAPLIFTYKNITSVIPPIASSVVTLGFYNKNVKLIRLFAALSSCLMLTYGAFNNSAATVINEIIVLCSMIISQIIFEIQKKRGKVK